MKSEHFLSAALMLQCAALAAAFGFEHIGGFAPCELCLTQRLPYYYGIPLTAGAWLLAGAHAPARWSAIAFALAGAAFVGGAGVGIYQVGAQYGFWPGPQSCGDTGALPAQAATLVQSLKSTRIASCTQVDYHLFGLSFAAWNVLTSTAIAGLLAIVAWRWFVAPPAANARNVTP